MTKLGLAIEKIYVAIAKLTPLPQFICLTTLSYSLCLPKGLWTVASGLGAMMLLLALEYRRGVVDGIWVATEMIDGKTRSVHNMLNLIKDVLKDDQ